MKIVHATTVHLAGDNRIAYKECRSAAEHGHEVVLVAARGDKPDIPGVEVVIVEGASTRFARFTSVGPAVAKAVVRAQPDIIHIHDPELLLVARQLSKHAPVVFDIHEDIPAQIRTKEWVPRVLRAPLVGIWRLTLGFSTRYLRGVVFARSDIVDESLVQNWVLVENFPRIEEFPPPASDSRRSDGLRLSYVGIITRSRGAVEMVQAVGELDSRLEPVLHLAGPIRGPGLAEELQSLPGWRRVHHDEWLNRHDVAALLAQTDIGFVLLDRAPNHMEAYPTKMFEYMAAGCSVIGTNLPTIQRIIDEVGCGVAVEPGNTAALVQAIESLAADRELLAEYGRRGREAIETSYNWSNEAKQLVALYDRIGEGRS